MILINLFAEPSAGKTATMFALAGKMKKMGFSVDIASEFYKDLVYQNTPGHNHGDIERITDNTLNQVKKFGGQLHILSEQNKRLSILNGTVDFAITDCPLPLIAYYTPKNYVSGFEEFAVNLFNTYENCNFYIKKNHEFENKARIHNEEQAKEIAIELPNYLKKFIKEPCTDVFTGDFIEDEIISHLVSKKLLTLPSKQTSMKVKI